MVQKSGRGPANRGGKVAAGRLCQVASGHARSVQNGIVKLRLTGVPDAQYGTFTTGSSPVFWGPVG